MWRWGEGSRDSLDSEFYDIVCFRVILAFFFSELESSLLAFERVEQLAGLVASEAIGAAPGENLAFDEGLAGAWDL